MVLECHKKLINANGHFSWICLPLKGFSQKFSVAKMHEQKEKAENASFRNPLLASTTFPFLPLSLICIKSIIIQMS
jgi:hypothetical protein